MPREKNGRKKWRRHGATRKGFYSDSGGWVDRASISGAFQPQSGRAVGCIRRLGPAVDRIKREAEPPLAWSRSGRTFSSRIKKREERKEECRERGSSRRQIKQSNATTKAEGGGRRGGGRWPTANADYKTTFKSLRSTVSCASVPERLIGFRRPCFFFSPSVSLSLSTRFRCAELRRADFIDADDDDDDDGGANFTGGGRLKEMAGEVTSSSASAGGKRRRRP